MTTTEPALSPLPPLYTAELFAPLHEELMGVLRALSSDDWERATVAPAWRVRDVAAHLLDSSLRRLSAERDGHLPPPDRPIRGYADLVGFLDSLNASWVAAARRLSPRVLLELLALSGPEVARFVATLAPHGPALFSVAWAGEDESESWMDIGREYTEWWHHQMQIRDAVGAPLLLERRWFLPLLELSLRALPRSYAGSPASDGTALVLDVAGDAGGTYTLLSESGAWSVFRGASEAPRTRVRLDPDTAWRLLYNALPPASARERLTVEGDAELVAPLLATRSVMV